MQLPAICTKPPRTYSGAYRQYRALIRAYAHTFNGGGMFGWDWVTMRSNAPQVYEKARELVAYINAAQQAANRFENIPHNPTQE